MNCVIILMREVIFPTDIFEKGRKPDPASLAGTTVKIKYDRNDPHFVCVIDDNAT